MIAEAMLNLDQEAVHDRQLIKAAARVHCKSIERDQREREEQGRRLRRYLKDAETRREAALKAWVEIEEKVVERGKNRKGKKRNEPIFYL